MEVINAISVNCSYLYANLSNESLKSFCQPSFSHICVCVNVCDYLGEESRVGAGRAGVIETKYIKKS